MKMGLRSPLSNQIHSYNLGPQVIQVSKVPPFSLSISLSPRYMAIPLLWFFKNPNPPITTEGWGSSHYEYYIWFPETALMVRRMKGTFEFDQPYKQTESKM